MNASSSARWAHEAPRLSADIELIHAPAIAPPDGRSDFIDRGLRNEITQRHGPAFLLLDTMFRDLPAGEATAEFIPEPFFTDEMGRRVGLMSATREDSKHTVQFGQIVLKAPDRRERVELVAIKPQSNVARATNEFRATQFINGLENPEGRPRGFEQLGFYRDVKSGLTATVSRYEHGVLTLDSLLWDEVYTPTERQICAALGHSAVILGDMHHAGIMHGDFQARNIAADNLGPRIPDLESAQKPKLITGGLDPLVANSMILHDLRYLAGDFERWPELVEHSFIEPYESIVWSDGTRMPEMAIPSTREIRALFLEHV
jgi:hypothetical protein